MEIRTATPAATPIQASTPGTLSTSPRPAAPVQLENAVTSTSAIVSSEEISDAVKTINEAMATQSQGVEFSFDADADATVVKIVDIETKEILRQIPSKEALEIAKALDRVLGLILKQTA